MNKLIYLIKKCIFALTIFVILFIISSLVQSGSAEHNHTTDVPEKHQSIRAYAHKLKSILGFQHCKLYPISSIDSIKQMLSNESIKMRSAVIQKVIRTISCAEQFQTRHNQFLAVIDYSLPANKKRLWVFDLQKNKLLYHTYVTHGIKSGGVQTNQFSNKNNSKASSIGIFRTGQAYYGRHGLSLRLTGLEPGFNDNASRRAIVMHSAWYVNESFIKKYGRPGRSWGCPAISKEMKSAVINTIKNNALFVAYYPGEQWFFHSKYLNCKHNSQIPNTEMGLTQLDPASEQRAPILFVERKKNHKHEDQEPVLVVSAEEYQRIFKQIPPLTRMLRCQMDGTEFIAMSYSEFEQLYQTNAEEMKHILFVVPEVRFTRDGHYKGTEMRKINLGRITSVKLQDNPDKSYQVNFDKGSPAIIKSTDQFIRWVGL